MTGKDAGLCQNWLVPFGKTWFRILVTQSECSHGSRLFYEPAQSTCGAELKIPIYNVNWIMFSVQRKKSFDSSLLIKLYLL